MTTEVEILQFLHYNCRKCRMWNIAKKFLEHYTFERKIVLFKNTQGLLGGYDRCATQLRPSQARLLPPNRRHEFAKSANDRLWHQQPPDSHLSHGERFRRHHWLEVCHSARPNRHARRSAPPPPRSPRTVATLPPHSIRIIAYAKTSIRQSD